MAVAFVRSHTLGTAIKASGTASTINISTATTAGNVLIAYVLFDNAATTLKPNVSTIAVAAGETNTWTKIQGAYSANTTVGSFASAEVFMIRTTVSWPVATYAITLDTATVMKVSGVQEFSGVIATLRSTAGTNYSTTTTAASASTTGTTPVIGDLAIGFIFNSNIATAPAGDTDTSAGSWSTVYGVGSTGSSAATNNFGGAQYKILTAATAQTLNNSAALNAGNGAIVAILQQYVPPSITQAASRWYADGTETGSTALAAQDATPTIDMSSGDVNAQLRVRLQSTTAVTVEPSDDWQLQWEKNASGAWTDVGATPQFVLTDSYSETNYNSTLGLAENDQGAGQSIMGTGGPLNRVRFWVRRVGAPTGTLTCYLYAHTGTFGTTGKGTGSPLATSSNTVDVGAMSTTFSWVSFDFDGSVTLAAGTPYVILATVNGTVTMSDYPQVGTDTTASTAPGLTQVRNTTGTWYTYDTDTLYEVYSTLRPTVVPYDSPNLTDAQEIISSSAETGVTLDVQLGAGTGNIKHGQSFLGTGKSLIKVRFWLKKVGAPSSTLVAEIWPHSGTFGSSSVGTGTVTATSTNSYVGGNLTTSYAWYEFTFSPVSLTLDTPYVIVVSTALNDASNYYHIGAATGGAATHPGNRVSKNASNWGYNDVDDIAFTAYAGSTVITNRLTGGSGTFTPGKVSEDGQVNDLGWAGNNYTELLYPLTFKQTDLINGDTLRLRVARGSIAVTEYTLGTSGFGASGINALGYGNDMWVAAGVAGKIATATDPDGIWTLGTSGFGAGTIREVAYANGVWVAVGDAGTIATATNPAGTWTLGTSGFGVSDIAYVVYGNGVWVIAGAGGKIATATDPTSTWTLGTSGFAGTVINGLGYGNGVWVIVGNTGKIATATDPTSTWTLGTSGFGTDTIVCVTYGNGVWVSGGLNGKLATATNPAGTWTLGASGFGVSGIYAATYGDGVWVIVGVDGKLAATVDPTSTWTLSTSGFGATTIYDVAYADGVWVAGGDAGTLSIFLTGRQALEAYTQMPTASITGGGAAPVARVQRIIMNNSMALRSFSR